MDGRSWNIGWKVMEHPHYLIPPHCLAMHIMPTVAIQSPFRQLRCKLKSVQCRAQASSWLSVLCGATSSSAAGRSSSCWPAARPCCLRPAARPAALGPHAVEQDRPPRAAPGEGAPQLRSPGTLCRPAPRRPAPATTSAGLPGPRPA